MNSAHRKWHKRKSLTGQAAGGFQGELKQAGTAELSYAKNCGSQPRRKACSSAIPAGGEGKIILPL